MAAVGLVPEAHIIPEELSDEIDGNLQFLAIQPEKQRLLFAIGDAFRKRKDDDSPVVVGGRVYWFSFLTETWNPLWDMEVNPIDQVPASYWRWNERSAVVMQDDDDDDDDDDDEEDVDDYEPLGGVLRSSSTICCLHSDGQSVGFLSFAAEGPKPGRRAWLFVLVDLEEEEDFETFFINPAEGREFVNLYFVDQLGCWVAREIYRGTLVKIELHRPGGERVHPEATVSDWISLPEYENPSSELLQLWPDVDYESFAFCDNSVAKCMRPGGVEDLSIHVRNYSEDTWIEYAVYGSEEDRQLLLIDSNGRLPLYHIGNGNLLADGYFSIPFLKLTRDDELRCFTVERLPISQLDEITIEHGGRNIQLATKESGRGGAHLDWRFSAYSCGRMIYNIEPPCPYSYDEQNPPEAAEMSVRGLVISNLGLEHRVDTLQSLAVVALVKAFPDLKTMEPDEIVTKLPLPKPVLKKFFEYVE